jgi:hypothetical protein
MYTDVVQLLEYKLPKALGGRSSNLVARSSSVIEIVFVSPL